MLGTAPMGAIRIADINMLVQKNLVDPMQTLVNPTQAQMQASGIWFVLGTPEMDLRYACRSHVVCVNFIRVNYPMRIWA